MIRHRLPAPRPTRLQDTLLRLLLAVLLLASPLQSSAQLLPAVPPPAPDAAAGAMPCHGGTAHDSTAQPASTPACPHCADDASAGACHCCGQAAPAGLAAIHIDNLHLTPRGNHRLVMRSDTLAVWHGDRLYRPPILSV